MSALLLSVNQILISDPVVLNTITINTNRQGGKIVQYLKRNGPATEAKIKFDTNLSANAHLSAYIDSNVVLVDKISAKNRNIYKINPQVTLKFSKR